jgi:hypothetical protein
MLFVALILTVILIATILVIAWYALDDFFGGEDLTTSESTIRKIGKFLIAGNYHHGILYDLGSARGHFTLGILKLCPTLHVVGIDDSLLRTWIARFRSRRLRDMPIFVKGDIFKEEVSEADVVFIYLPRPLLADIEKKLKNELRPGALAITSRVSLPSWHPEEILRVDSKDPSEETVYVYRR